MFNNLTVLNSDDIVKYEYREKDLSNVVKLKCTESLKPRTKTHKLSRDYKFSQKFALAQ